MKLQDPRLQEALAGAYVLGTLAHRARRRFEQLLASDLGLRRRVRAWEARLAPLNAAVIPVEPPARVWTGLLERMGLRKRPAVERVGFWQSLAGLSAAAAIVLAVTLGTQQHQPQQILVRTEQMPVAAESYVAIVQVPKTDLHWLVTLTPAAGQVAMLASGKPPTAATGKDMELWWIAASGPVSLGLMPKSGESRHALPAGLPLSSGGTIAVSLEPAGGSPTGKPTGPVLVAAQVVRTI